MRIQATVTSQLRHLVYSAHLPGVSLVLPYTYVTYKHYFLIYIYKMQNFLYINASFCGRPILMSD